MSTMMDIIIASVFGSIILLTTLNANFVIKQAWATYNSEMITQQMLISTAQILECDLRNMGCGMDNGAQTITEARDTCIGFDMALRPEFNSPIRHVKFYAGSTLEDGVKETENPVDRFLYRQIQGQQPERIGLVAKFLLRYMESDGTLFNPAPGIDPSKLIDVRIIEITMEVQSPFAAYLDPEKRYTSALWKQTRLASQNLKR